jgi:hypothetical protein
VTVLNHAVILARKVSADLEYADLTYLPSNPPQYGIFNPVAGEWLEQFDAATCRQRLQAWPEIPVTWERRDQLVAFITDAGHVWLEQIG